MRNIVLLSIVLVLILVLAGCIGSGVYKKQNTALFRNTAGFVDGIYEGAAQGYRGLIHVQVLIEGGVITEITILDSKEDRYVGDAAIEDLIEQVLYYNNTDIDAICGATESSDGFLAALAEALGTAGKVR